jgi:hypothetical protein
MKKYIVSFFVFYIASIIVWNTVYTNIPDKLLQNIEIEKIEKGDYSTSIFFSSYDYRIKVKNKHINYLYVKSSKKNFDLLKEGNSYWIYIECLEAANWADFFTFNINFNYKIISIPKQTNNNFEEDSLIWTAELYVFIGFILILLIGLAFKYIKKK